MNRAFSADGVARHEFLGRCPRLPMNTAPLALNTYLKGEAKTVAKKMRSAPPALARWLLIKFDERTGKQLDPRKTLASASALEHDFLHARAERFRQLCRDHRLELRRILRCLATIPLL